MNMNTLLTPSNITFALGIIAVIFSIYNSFRNPQIKTDQITTRIQDDLKSLQKEVLEIKTSHLVSIEANMSKLSDTITSLSITVTRLSTIIDERIPKMTVK